MKPLGYVRADTLQGALRAATSTSGARLLAGGTSLVDLMRLGVETPSALVDINQLPLAEIQVLPDGGLRVGALARNSDLAAHPRVRASFPALREALLSGASPQIRNMATMGGNLLQRTRCSYFREPGYACNKRSSGSGCAAREGFNRHHAVLGTSASCIATHPSDMAVALVALDADVQTVDTDGTIRSIPAADFHVSPDADPARESVLGAGELIVAVELPSTPWFARSHYLKIRDRAAFDFALVSAAVALDLEGTGPPSERRIRAVRVALGGVGTKPWRSPEAEAVLIGAAAEPGVFRAAAEAALAGAIPSRHNAFKIELAKRTLIRALETVSAMEP